MSLALKMTGLSTPRILGSRHLFRLRGADGRTRRRLEVLARPGTTTVEVDLRGVTFLDSAGLSALATAHRSAQAGGRDLRMRCGTTRAVARPLQLSGLWHRFEMVDVPEGLHP